MKRRALAGITAALALALPAAGVHAQTPKQGPPIFRCTDANGKRTTTDRIVSCSGRLDELNADGSIKREVPRALSVEEDAERQERERAAEQERKRRLESARRDQQLLRKFPDESFHQRARKLALEEVSGAIANIEKRIEILKADRVKLNEEAEFYPKKENWPAKLKSGMDANDAGLNAQKELIQNQQSEFVRINALYDAELLYLKKLWAGAVPGSLGTPPQATPNVKVQAAAPRS